MRFFLTCIIAISIIQTAIGAELEVPSQYSTVQSALNAASDGDEILIENGTYDISNLVIDDIDITISAVNHYEPEATANVILDCDSNGSSIIRAFYVKNNASLTLNSVKILDGHHYIAGAILLTDSSITLNNCEINNCSSESTGGAISASGSSAAINLTNCSISGNSATDYGGAIYITESESVSITGTDFTNNTSENYGGCFMAENVSNITISTCSITGNTSDETGGGLAFDYCENILICNSLIAGNYADGSGGGISIDNSVFSSSETNDIIISNCIITENKCNTHGGGLKAFNSELLLANTIIHSNELTDDEAADYYELAIKGSTSQVLMAHCMVQNWTDITKVDTPDVILYAFLANGSLLTDLGGNVHNNEPEFTLAGSWDQTTWTQGNYIPAGGSYCYNSGLNDYLADILEYDLAGAERLQADFVDIGCYELEPIDGGDITATVELSLKFPQEIIPGDRGTCIVTISNAGNADISGEMAVNLYLSEDKYIIEDEDTLLAQTTRDVKVNFLTAKPKDRTQKFKITVPSTIDAGKYYILVQLDPEDNIDEADESINSNIVASEQFDIFWKFGSFGNRKNATLTILDADGIENQYILKSGEGQLLENRRDIEIISESEKCSLTIKPRTKGVTPSIGDIDCTGSFSLIAKTCDLSGDITVSGVMPKFMVNDISSQGSGSVVTISGSSENSSSAMTMIASDISDMSLLSENFPIKTIKINSWTNSNDSYPQITSRWIKSITCKEDFEADITLDGLTAAKDIALSSASIKGDINNCQWDITGLISKISADSITALDLTQTEPEGNTGKSAAINSITVKDSITNCQWETNGYINKLTASEIDNMDMTINASIAENTRQTGLGSASIKGDISNSQWLIDGNVNKMLANAIIDSKLFIGAAEELSEPTGVATDIASEYSLSLQLKDNDYCINNSDIIVWELAKFTFGRNAISDENSYIEFFDAKREPTLPENIQTNARELPSTSYTELQHGPFTIFIEDNKIVGITRN